MKLIGKGSFSKVYHISKDKVLIHSDDPVKECMGLGWFPKTRLFPTIKNIHSNVYESKYYRKCSSPKVQLVKKDYDLYKELRVTVHGVSGYNILLASISNINSKYRLVKQHLMDAVSALANYGDDMCFEISPRNIACNNGRLILLDCFYMKEALLNKLGASRGNCR